MFLKKSLFFICFLALTMPQGRVDGVAAMVGNNIILHSDILQQAQITALDQHIDPMKSPYLFEEIYSATLINLINQYTVLDIADKDTNIVISDDEVNRALEGQINDFITRAGSEENFEEMVGMSLRQIKAEYWHEIRNMMAVERYQYSTIQNIDVSRSEVYQFFDSFKDSLPPEPERYDFSVIEAPFKAGKKSEDKAYELLSSLRELLVGAGMSFDSLAKIYSDDPGSAPSGGFLGFTERGSLLKEFEEVAYSMQLGEISLPVKTVFGYHLIKLLDRKGEKISTQHILKIVSFSNNDKGASFDIISNISSLAKNDPFVFDSLSMEYASLYNNHSGKYTGISPAGIPFEISNELGLLSRFEMSVPIELSTGAALIYLYDHNDEFYPSPENSWDLIYKYAKQEKQNRLFLDWVDKIKDETFIRVFNN